jgi:FtsZ-interacting cell division protein ZipA
MTLVDLLIIIGAIVLVAIVIMGFRRSSRIPPSGRDPSNFEGPP